MSRLALSNPKDPLMAPRLETFSAASGQKSRSLKCFETNARMKEKMNFLHFLFHQEKVSKVLRSQIDFDTPIHFRSKPIFLLVGSYEVFKSRDHVCFLCMELEELEWFSQCEAPL